MLKFRTKHIQDFIKNEISFPNANPTIIARVIYYNIIRKNNKPSRMILDICAIRNMTRNKKMFTSLSTIKNKNVILGDGITTLPVLEVVTINIKFNNHNTIIPNVLFIPSLKDVLYSVIEHIQNKDYNLLIINNTYTLGSPNFDIKAIVDDKVFVNITHSSIIPSSHLLIDTFNNIAKNKISNKNIVYNINNI